MNEVSTKSYSEIRQEIEKLEQEAILVRLGEDANDLEKSIKVISYALMSGRIQPSGLWIGRVYLLNNAKLIRFIPPQEQLSWTKSPKGAFYYMRLLVRTFGCKNAIELLAAL